MVVADSLPDLAPLKPIRGDIAAPAFPPVLERAGSAACFAADEFFSARISNPETRRAYGRAVGWFLEFCEREEIELVHVTPGLAGRFLRDLPVSAATKNQALAGLRHFFDALVTRHAVVLNPFHSVRGIQHQVLDGKTPEISLSQARRLFAAIELDSPMGLRDRAMLGTLITTGCRIGALCRLRIGDLRTHEEGRLFRFREKNGKEREIPVRDDLDEWIQAYMQAAGVGEDPPGAPLWRGGASRRIPHPPPGRPSRRPGHAQAPARRRRAPRQPDSSLVPRHGRHRPALPERPRRGGPAPGRALPPVHHPALRPAAPARHPQNRRANPFLGRPEPSEASPTEECCLCLRTRGGLSRR